MSPLLLLLFCRHVGSEFPDQGSNLHPLHCKLRVLTTGPPGKSPGHVSLRNIGYSCQKKRESILDFQAKNVHCQIKKLRLGEVKNIRPRPQSWEVAKRKPSLSGSRVGVLSVTSSVQSGSPGNPLHSEWVGLGCSLSPEWVRFQHLSGAASAALLPSCLWSCPLCPGK